MFRIDGELRSAAWVLACAFVMSLAGPVVLASHGSGLCPAGCPDSLAGLVHASGAVESARSAADAEHCQLCHWLRDVSRAVPQPTASATIDLNPTAGLCAHCELGRSPRGVDERPSRSPPRLPL